jgi:hypothetical protein
MSNVGTSHLLQYHVTSAKAVMWFCEEKTGSQSQNLGEVGFVQ